MKSITISGNNLEVLFALEMFGSKQIGNTITFNIANIKYELSVPSGVGLGPMLHDYILSLDYNHDVVLTSDDPDWTDHLSVLVNMYRNCERIKLKDIVGTAATQLKDAVKNASHEVVMQIGEHGHDIKNCIKITSHVITLGHYITSPTVRRKYKNSNFLGKLKINAMPILLEQVALAGVNACVKYKEGYDKAKAESDKAIRE